MKSLTNRTNNIPTTSDDLSKELKQVTPALLANGYPKRFIIDSSKPKRSPKQSVAAAPEDVKNQWRGVIYSIPCTDCDKHYIEEAKRKFNTRHREHQKAVEQKQPKKSALAERCLQSGHAISWESSTILRTSTSWRNRPLLEAWEINTWKSPLNRDVACTCPKSIEP